jgi:uncharacterized membrane protein
MLWLLENVDGSPVILEAQVPEYRWGSRFANYTGLPTVQGWNWHQRQQRSVVPSIAVERRVAHVQELYNTTDLARTSRLLALYGVRYIIVGELERAYYGAEGLAKFDAMAQDGSLEVAHQAGAVTIYRVGEDIASAATGVPAGIGPRPAPTSTPSTRTFLSPQ